MRMKRPLVVTVCAVTYGGLALKTLLPCALSFMVPYTSMTAIQTGFALVSALISLVGLASVIGLLRMARWSLALAPCTMFGAILLHIIISQAHDFWIYYQSFFEGVLLPALLIWVLTRTEVKLAFVTTPAVVEEDAAVADLASQEKPSV